MGFCFSNTRGAGFAAAAVAAILAGCQSGDGSSALESAAGPKAPETVKASELRAFCPRVELREGTAFFNTYERGAKAPENVIYQASIDDVTRTCAYDNGNLTMTIGAAGRIVPGPKGKAGSVTLPIRLVLVQDGAVASSELYKQQVAVTDTIGATQFVFTNSTITMPQQQNTRALVYVGFDEGPPSKKRN